jgi:hypothetical protein
MRGLFRTNPGAPFPAPWIYLHMAIGQRAGPERTEQARAILLASDSSSLNSDYCEIGNGD